MNNISAADQALLDKINAVVAGIIVAESLVEETRAKLVSHSKEVGLLLLEAKKRHPAVKDFEAFLKRVQGLSLSRAYDCMRIAGGRTTDEELRQETRERVRKHRAKKKIPKPEPVSVTDPDVTESPKQIPTPNRITQSPEISPEQRRADMAALDSGGDERTAKASAKALAEFLVACRTWLPKITAEADRLKVSRFIDEWMLRPRAVAA